MDNIALLQDCRSYFHRAQASWDKYFSKWETMAKEENTDLEDNLLDSEVGTVRKETKRNLVARQLLKKSVLALHRKRFKSGRKMKTKWKRDGVQGGKSRDRKRGTEIIHTTENQTNLECEVVNNKHFEADLKEIFIEILSENTNKIGMFSVLSRTFSATGETISNFSLGSMIMEKKGFSISPVRKTVLHSGSRNEFPLGGIPRGEVSDSFGRSCVNVMQCHASNVHVLPMGHLSTLQDTRRLPQQNHRLTTADVNIECEEPVNRWMSTNCDSFRRLSMPNQVSYSPEGSTDFVSRGCLSPETVLAKVFQTPSTAENSKRKCVSENVMKRRRRVKSGFESSDDESEETGIDSSPGRFLRIFCTPKRSKRFIKHEESSDETVLDDDDCFRIFDRVKSDNN